MSFSEGGITFYESEDNPTKNYEPGHALAVDYLWGFIGNQLYRVSYDLLKPASETPTEIYLDANHFVRCLDGAAGTALYCKAFSGGILFTGNSTANRWFDINKFEGLRLLPAGSGQQVYADEYVEWSVESIKDNIQDLMDAKARLAQLRPKTFDKANIPRVGLVVESTPASYVRTVDVEGKQVSGISQSDILGVLVGALKEQQVEIDDLKARVTALEKLTLTSK
jgi:hypothetical protein